MFTLFFPSSPSCPSSFSCFPFLLWKRNVIWIREKTLTVNGFTYLLLALNSTHSSLLLLLFALAERWRFDCGPLLEWVQQVKHGMHLLTILPASHVCVMCQLFEQGISVCLKYDLQVIVALLFTVCSEFWLHVRRCCEVGNHGRSGHGSRCAVYPAKIKQKHKVNIWTIV